MNSCEMPCETKVTTPYLGLVSQPISNETNDASMVSKANCTTLPVIGKRQNPNESIDQMFESVDDDDEEMVINLPRKKFTLN